MLALSSNVLTVTSPTFGLTSDTLNCYETVEVVRNMFSLLEQLVLTSRLHIPEEAEAVGHLVMSVTLQ